MVEDSIRTFALQDAAILALTGQRFYADFVPDKSPYPHVKYSEIDDDQKYTHSGDSGHIPLYQLDIYDTTKAECNALAELIFSRFSGHKGIMGDVLIGYCFAKNALREWSSDKRKFRRVIELRIGTNDR